MFGSKKTQASHIARALTLPIILLLATFLRFYRISGQSLWADEGNSVALAQRSFSEIARRTAFDIHPPLYYWLLKIWIGVWGDSEFGLRALSAVLGVGLILLIWILGVHLFSRRVGLAAAFLAALSPLQVYYSQEARMYMLLAFLGCLTILLGLFFIDRPHNHWLNIAYILTVTAGLYTHYAYSVILIAINLSMLFYLIRKSPFTLHHPILIRWIVLQLIPFLFYLPWLPVAWRQVTTWPTEGHTLSLHEVFDEVSNTLLSGHSRPFEWGVFPAIALGVALLLVPSLMLRIRYRSSNNHVSLLLLYLWFLLPVSLTMVIFSPAFLKFLLVASPPLMLLLALLIDRLTVIADSRRNLIGPLVGGTLLAVFSIGPIISLYHYYGNPTFARDNYRGIVNFIKAVGSPTDAVILNAEGQQDVFNYYYEQSPELPVPVYPLPRQRPLDETATINELQTIAAQSNRVYALYWAARQADPQGLIEDWLNAHLYKATDQWHGNVRLVSYASPQTDIANNLNPVDHQLGRHIHLTGFALASKQAAPGEILQLALQWETEAPLAETYIVFGQVLDSANHLVGQRDAPPLIPTSAWPVGKPVTDTHGIFIEPGTPPGKHRLILGLYNRKTGQRLPVKGGNDFVELTEVEIVRRETSLPLEAFRIQEPLNTPLAGVTLLGYDFYKLGHRSDPDTPLHSGDAVQVVAYWTPNQPEQQPPAEVSIQVVTHGGEVTPLSFTYPIAGVNYALETWTEDEIVRAQYDFFLSDLKPGSYRLKLTLKTDGAARQAVTFARPFSIEP